MNDQGKPPRWNFGVKCPSLLFLADIRSHRDSILRLFFFSGSELSVVCPSTSRGLRLVQPCWGGIFGTLCWEHLLLVSLHFVASSKIGKVSEKYHILLCIFLLATLGILRMHFFVSALAVKGLTSGRSAGDSIFLSWWGQSEGKRGQFSFFLSFFHQKSTSYKKQWNPSS